MTHSTLPRHARRISWTGIYQSAVVVTLFCVAAAIAAPAQTFTKLADFGATDTAAPDSPLVQGLDGNLYGTTYDGTSGNYGSVYNVSTLGALNMVYGFNSVDGSAPAGVIQASDGNFYGTTQYGGANDLGSVFKVTPGGTLTTLYSFSGSDGAHPAAGLVQGADGNFYGTTTQGGTNYSFGTIFKITSGGTLTTIHRFHLNDGKGPSAALVQLPDGKFY